MTKTFVSFFVLFIIVSSVFAQVSVQSSSGMTAEELVNSVFVGEGVLVRDVKFNNNTGVLNSTTGAQLGTFSNNLSGFPGLTFTDGIMLTTGNVSVAVGPNDTDAADDPVTNSVTCTELEDIAGTIYLIGIPIANEVVNPAVLEFDFMTTSNMVTFNYVFGSEEYPEWVGESYNDAFGFFVTDLTTNQTSNVAVLPNTNVPVSINNVNAGSYSQYYHTVPENSPWMQYDAYIGPLSATFAVVPCRWYHIKLAITNVTDELYDSGVFLQGQSFTADATMSQMIYDREDLPIVVQDCNTCTVTFNVNEPQNQDVVIPLTYSGTAVNGVDVAILPSSVTIPAGQTSTTIVVSAIGDFTPDTLVLNIYYESIVCQEGITLTLYVCKNAGIEVSSEDVIVCHPVDEISISVVNGIPGDIQWTPADLLADPNSLSTGFISDPTEPTNYTVTVWDRFHCTSTTTNFLYGFGEPVTDTINASICQGEVYSRYGFNQTEAGSYTHQSQSAYGCDSLITLNLSVYDPQVEIQAGTTDLCEDGYVDLSAVISGEGVRWSSGEQTESITVTTPGMYIATAYDHQCTATDFINFIPCPDAEIYIPNAITPSDLNGINDVFYVTIPESVELEQFEIMIYNRWGMLIFHSLDPHFRWNGQVEGQLLSGETYVYSIRLKSKWHKAKMYKGIVTVF